MTPTKFVAKWTKLKFTAANYDKIDDSYLREFTEDLAETFGVEAVTVPPYVAGFTYSVGNLVRFTQLNGPEGFYYAIKAGKLASPQGNFTDWKVVPGPILPTELSQAMTLSQAQGLDQAGVVAGREYLIDCGPDGNGHTQTVTVRGIANDFYDVEGTLEVAGVRTPITDFKVQAGTWQLKQYSAGYTDAQARAAQLGRVAPAGTTTVTLTSESARDYGTATSNSFVVDATNAVQDAGASFRLGVGASAPVFTGAPAGRPFQYLGMSYTSGKAYGYSILVLADCIQVITYSL